MGDEVPGEDAEVEDPEMEPTVADDEAGAETEDPAGDEFATADASAGGEEPADRAKRESVELSRRLGQLLAGSTKAKYIQIWHSQVVWKPRSKNQKGNAGWHRDSQYWPFWSKEGLYTAWIALTDVSINSGPLRFIRGSNLWKTVQGLSLIHI